VVGVKTTLRFGRFVLEHPDFISGRFDTGFVAKNFSADSLHPRPENAQWAAALAESYRPEALENQDMPPVSRWKARYNP
jgi:acetyl/propionyl-CoA carboxylase alpha subunit